jgi:hypothetical protein
MFKQLYKWTIPALVLGIGLFGATTSVAKAATLVTTAKQFNYSSSAGGKGQDIVPLKAPAACATFVSADIKYIKQRYGQATINKLPAKGCEPNAQQCLLNVTWEHAPAGRLNYEVNVTWDTRSEC